MKSFVFTCAIFGALLSVPALQAGNLATPCVAGTLSSYTFNSDTGFPECSVGILNFTDFTFSASGNAGTNTLTASEIELTPCQMLEMTVCSDLPPTDPLSGGFTVSATGGGAFHVDSGQTETYTIEWHMVIDPGPIGTSADMGMDPPDGNVSIMQKYCTDATIDGPTFCSNIVGFQTITVSTPPCTDPINHPENCTSHLDFHPVIQEFADVVTVITLNGSSGPSDFGSFTGVTNVVDPTPEPASLMLGLTGLIGIGFLRRRKR